VCRGFAKNLLDVELDGQQPNDRSLSVKERTSARLKSPQETARQQKLLKFDSNTKFQSP
jgi:hypothetical protein